MISILIASILLLADTPAIEVQLDRKPPSLKTGKLFRDELNKPLTASMQNIPLRRVLRRIEESRQVSILLDRRIDPTQSLSVEFNGLALKSAIDEIATKANGRVSVLANTIYIGPRDGSNNLRTLAAIRFAELQQSTLKLPKGRFAELGKRHTIHWNDLDRPVDVIQRIAKRYDVGVDGLDRIPHDLWAEGTLPAANAVEAFSVVLIQFDLTFEWNENASRLQIVPMPNDVSISRPYRPRGISASRAAKEWTAKIDGLRATTDGRRVLVSGTVEQHEAVAAMLRPSRGRPVEKPPTGANDSLEKRKYAKLKFSRVPAIALIHRLEKTGIVFDYDEDELKGAGIDLNMPISMDLQDATATEVFAAFCKPLGLKFATKGLTVTLSPK